MDNQIKQIITLEFYEHYLIGTPEEINIGVKEAEEVGNIANEFYTGNFGYVGNRKNLNSVDPMAYKYIEKNFPRAIAFAIVCYSDYSEKFLELEKKFQSEKFKFKGFTDLENAKVWMLSNFI